MSEVIGQINGIDMVEVDRVDQSGTNQVIIDDCPYCGNVHHHGYADRPINSFTHRGSHCGEDGPNGYYLTFTENTVWD